MAIHILGALAIPAFIHIAGVAMPIDTFKGLPNIVGDLMVSAVKHENPHQTFIRALPDIGSVVISISNVLVPGSGIVEVGLIFLIKNSKPPTQQEQQRMWDQAQGIH